MPEAKQQGSDVVEMAAENSRRHYNRMARASCAAIAAFGGATAGAAMFDPRLLPVAGIGVLAAVYMRRHFSRAADTVTPEAHMPAAKAMEEAAPETSGGMPRGEREFTDHEWAPSFSTMMKRGRR
ncbi:MAG: hypothetical protein WC989_00325 [Micavibrio sp.]